MPVPLLAGGLALGLAVPLVVKILVGLGVGFATYTGAGIVLLEAESFINARMANLPSDLFEILSMMGFLQGLQILFASYSAALSIKVTLGVFSKVTFRNPTL